MTMKTLLFLTLLFTSQRILAGPCAALESFEQLVVDFDKNGTDDIGHRRSSTLLVNSPPTTVFDVAYAVRGIEPTRLVRASSARIDFDQGQAIAEPNKVHLNAAGFSAAVLTDYILTGSSGESFSCAYDGSIPTWNDRVVVIVGVRLQGDDGVHYGWVRFTRPDLEPSTPFVIAGHDWNPIPDAPIEAGLPPPLPPLQAQFTGAGLSLVWDARFTGLLLEWTDTVGQSDWQPVPDASTPPVTVRPDSEQRFYRLRRP